MAADPSGHTPFLPKDQAMVPLPLFNSIRTLPQDECPLCTSPNLNPALISSTFWQNERLIVVENIPATVCADCGEKYYTEAVGDVIKAMLESGFPVAKADYFIRVPVFSFPGWIPTLDRSRKG